MFPYRLGLSVLSLVAALCVAIKPGLVHAQNAPAIVTPIGGTVDLLAPGGVIEFNGADTNRYMVRMAPNAKFWVHGTAERELLKPGMTVLFSAQLNKQQTIVEGTVGQLTIFTPSEDYQVGIYEDVGKPLDKKEGEKPAATGLDSAAFGGGGAGNYRVGGVIKTVRNNQLTLLVGKKKIRAELADDLEVKVEVSDIAAVNKGAKISVVRGKIVAPGQLLADEVDITLIEPLAAPTKKGRKPKLSAAERKAEKDADKDAADAKVEAEIKDSADKILKKLGKD